jgi:uncharacterized protein YkwD
MDRRRVTPLRPALGGNRVLHDHEQDTVRKALSPDVSSDACSNRRHFLALLTALPAALGLVILGGDESADAKKHKGKKDKKRKRRGKNGKNGKNKNKNKKKKNNGENGGYSPDGEERAFLDLINDYRRRNGAGDLALNDQLGAAAEHHSQDMASKNYFSHNLKNGDSAQKNIERHGYTNWTYWGENIAAGDETAKQVMESWKNSAEHDRAMRDKNFKEIGIGRAYAKSSKYGWYWTTTFGARR